MQISFPDVIVKAKAACLYTQEDVLRRLAEIAEKQDEAAIAEVKFLQKVLAKWQP